MTKTPKAGDRIRINPKFVENKEIRSFQKQVLSELDPEKVYTIKEVQNSFKCGGGHDTRVWLNPKRVYKLPIRFSCLPTSQLKKEINMAPLKVGDKPKIRTEKELRKSYPTIFEGGILLDFLQELEAVPQSERIVTHVAIGCWEIESDTFDSVQFDMPQGAMWGSGLRSYPSVLFQPTTAKRR